MFKKDSIFFKILVLTVSLIIFVCIVLTSFSIRISKKIMMGQIINSTNQKMEYAKDEILNYNEEIVEDIYKINQSKAFREYLSDPILNNSNRFDLVNNLNVYLDSNKNHLTPRDSHIVVTGKNSMWYISDSLNWNNEMKSLFSRTSFSKANNNVIKYEIIDTSSIKRMPFKNMISVGKPLYNLTSNDIYGFLYIVLDERVINNMYNKYVENGMTFYLISSEGTIMSSSDSSEMMKVKPELLSTSMDIVDNDLSSENIKIGKDNKTILSKYIPFIDGYLVASIDHTVLFSKLYSLQDYMIIMLILLLIITCVSIYLIYYAFSKPLVTLVDTMSKNTRYSLDDGKVVAGDTYEIRMITQAYNSMISEIDLHVKNLISEQEQRRKAELNALQMQINPHFLYNTLSTIKYLARSEKINEVDNTINCLISILQNTIGTTDEMIAISTEIENLKQYVYINKLRFGDFINVDYQISESCFDILIPKLILQPFVENAFFHAFQGKDSGNISIYINKKSKHVLIEIIDNGIGFNCSDVDFIKKKKRTSNGIGIKNVDERIKLIYGSKYKVEIESELGYGTCISIRLPII